MKDKNFAEAPLLYITQPDVKNPKAAMQSQYISKKRKKTTVQPKQMVEETDGEIKYTSAQNEDEEIKNDENVQRNKEKRKRKSFREMSIVEKVHYFIDSPSYTPKVKCEVRTAAGRHRGVIVALEGNEVILKAGERSLPKKVLLEEIKDIRLIGF